MSKLVKTEIKVGDIITTYHKGYWRLIEIERRFLTESDLRYEVYKKNKVGDEYSPIYHYELVLDEAADQRNKKKESCDSAYCKKLDKKQIAQRIANLEMILQSLD